MRPFGAAGLVTYSMLMSYMTSNTSIFLLFLSSSFSLPFLLFSQDVFVCVRVYLCVCVCHSACIGICVCLSIRHYFNNSVYAYGQNVLILVVFNRQILIFFFFKFLPLYWHTSDYTHMPPVQQRTVDKIDSLPNKTAPINSISLKAAGCLIQHLKGKISVASIMEDLIKSSAKRKIACSDSIFITRFCSNVVD